MRAVKLTSLSTASSRCCRSSPAAAPCCWAPCLAWSNSSRTTRSSAASCSTVAGGGRSAPLVEACSRAHFASEVAYKTNRRKGRGRKGCGCCNATRSRLRTNDSTHKPLHCIIPLLLKYVCFLTDGGGLSPDIVPCLLKRFPDHALLGPCCSKVTQGLVQRILSELASQGGLLLRQNTGGGEKERTLWTGLRHQ